MEIFFFWWTKYGLLAQCGKGEDEKEEVFQDLNYKTQKKTAIFSRKIFITIKKHDLYLLPAPNKF